ncbi:hypothetical protein LSAT2_030333 [Lamellibrachia satsuma]|nr:hypothetical protein LSAT2_030333 [Lamellibrachia satsuma]
MFKWTVNWRFLPLDIFLSRYFHAALLACHIAVLLIFLFTRWHRMFGGVRGLMQLKGTLENISANDMVLMLFTANFIGVMFSRSLHYQFYVWYFHSLPYLLWHCTCLPVILRLLVLGVIEQAWNTYPSTNYSSASLHLCHLVILLSLWWSTRTSPSAHDKEILTQPKIWLSWRRTIPDEKKEPGEIYFEDFSAFYYSAGLDNEQAVDRRQRGRLKVSSKSVVFDPKDVKYPILKFAFRDVTQVEKWESPLLSRIDSKDQMFLIETEQVTKMKENYAIGPYVFVKEKTCHLFGLIYQPVHSCLASLCQLQRAATLPRSDQVAMINAIVSFRQHRIKFDRRWLEDLYEKIIMETRGDHITPLLTNPGRIVVTTSRLYFQPFNNVEAVSLESLRL